MMMMMMMIVFIVMKQKKTSQLILRTIHRIKTVFRQFIHTRVFVLVQAGRSCGHSFWFVARWKLLILGYKSVTGMRCKRHALNCTRPSIPISCDNSRIIEFVSSASEYGHKDTAVVVRINRHFIWLWAGSVWVMTSYTHFLETARAITSTNLTVICSHFVSSLPARLSFYVANEDTGA